MATNNNLGDFLTSVANAIRTKTGGTSPINAQDFSTEIANIPTGTSLLDNTVNFIADSTDYSIVSVKSGVNITAPQTPLKSGYVFKGWGLTDSATSYISFPYTPSASELNLYAVYMEASKCIVDGLGSSSPSSVVFTKDAGFTLAGLGIEEVVIDGNTFIKIPTMYKKFDTVVSNQLTKFTIANAKIDNTYQPYPCFLDENNNLLDYILIGKYIISSTTVANSIDATPTSLSIGNGRTLCQAKTDASYQGLLYDWQIHQLWRDLIICFKQTVNTNSGSGIGTNNIDDLGIYWNSTKGYYIDGISYSGGSTIAVSYKPSSYVDSATTSTTNYTGIGYSATGTSDATQNITKLGYDSNHPFVNVPTSRSGTSFTTYYCDGFKSTTGNNPLSAYITSTTDATSGVFCSFFWLGWNSALNCRLCLRPIA